MPVCEWYPADQRGQCDSNRTIRTVYELLARPLDSSELFRAEVAEARDASRLCRITWT